LNGARAVFAESKRKGLNRVKEGRSHVRSCEGEEQKKFTNRPAEKLNVQKRLGEGKSGGPEPWGNGEE